MGGHLTYTISYDSAVRDDDGDKKIRGHPNIIIEVGMFVAFFDGIFITHVHFSIKTCIKEY